MSGIGLARGISGLALPTALAIAWLQKRKQADGPPTLSETGSRSPRVRTGPPSRRSLRSMIREETDLSNLDLRGVSMTRSDLRGRNFTSSDLSGARLGGAKLSGAVFSGATLDFADLSGCDLRGADLSGASLLETSLFEADLRGADLSRCRNLIMANLRRAVYDSTTRWPGRLDARTLGAIREKNDPR